MNGTAQVRYSAEVLAKLGQTLDSIASRTRVVVTQDESYTNYQEGTYSGTAEEGGEEE